MKNENTKMGKMENKLFDKVKNKNTKEDGTAEMSKKVKDMMKYLETKINNHDTIIKGVLNHSNEGLKVTIMNLKMLHNHLERNMLERTTITIEEDAGNTGPGMRTRGRTQRKVPEKPKELKELQETIQKMEDLQKKAEEMIIVN